MQAFTAQVLPGRLAAPSLNNRSNRRTNRAVVARAAQADSQDKREEKVLNKVVVSAISVAAAASLALSGPAFALDSFPRNAAPDLSLAKDDELVGKAFEKAGIPGDGPKEADALRDAAGLGADARSTVAGKAQGLAEDVAKKAKNAAPDLSLGKDDELLGNAFQKAGVPGDGNKAADALRDATPGVGNDAKATVQGQAQGAADAVGSAANKAQNAAPDLSLGKDDELLGNAFQKAGVPGDGNKAADALRDATPGVGDDAKATVQGQAQGAADAAESAANKAQNAAPDLSLGKDDQALGNAFQKAGIPGDGNKAADALRDATPGVGDDAKATAQGKASEAANKAKNAAPDLSEGKDDELVGNALEKAGIPGNAPKVANELRDKTPGISSDAKSNEGESNQEVGK